jgi:hypothetical protein
MAATASGQRAQDPDDEGFLSEFELILPKFVAILKSIQDGGEDRDIVRLALTPSPSRLCCPSAPGLRGQRRLRV